MDDVALLREFVEAGSEPAFRQLVDRHVNLVYSTARRRLGDPHLAQDVAQQVFIRLVRKAARLPRGVVVAGWLYRTTCHVAAETVRRETRHQRHLAEAADAMNTENATGVWHEIEPLLDAAMTHLDHADRDAIVLRYFENKSLREVGAALGVSDDAAQKRLSRALEKLRRRLATRERPLTVSSLVAALAAGAVQSAPSGLAAVLSGAALSQAVVAPSIALTIMSWTTLKSVVTATAVLAAGTTIGLQTVRLQTATRERAQLLTRAEAAEQEAQAARSAAARAAQAAESDPRTVELARLRAEVTALRRQYNETATENARLKEAMLAVNRNLEAQAREVEEDPEREALKTVGIAKLNYGKHWALAFHLFAGEHNDRLPATFEEAAAFFGTAGSLDSPGTVADPRTQTFVISTQSGGVTNLTLLKPEQFEITHQGLMSQITDPANTIIIREKEPFSAGDQPGLVRTYVFADGHTEIHRAPDGDFTAWEQQRGLTASR